MFFSSHDFWPRGHLRDLSLGPKSRGTFQFHSFQGSFFPANLQEPRLKTAGLWKVGWLKRMEKESTPGPNSSSREFRNSSRKSATSAWLKPRPPRFSLFFAGEKARGKKARGFESETGLSRFFGVFLFFIRCSGVSGGGGGGGHDRFWAGYTYTLVPVTCGFI